MRASVNTLVVRDGRIEGHSTDTAILAALAAERPVVIGDGGSATAFMEALPHARQFSRRTAWPPEVGDADLVVNATSERDDVLVELERRARRSSICRTRRRRRPPQPARQAHG